MGYAICEATMSELTVLIRAGAGSAARCAVCRLPFAVCWDGFCDGTTEMEGWCTVVIGWCGCWATDKSIDSRRHWGMVNGNSGCNSGCRKKKPAKSGQHPVRRTHWEDPKKRSRETRAGPRLALLPTNHLSCTHPSHMIFGFYRNNHPPRRWPGNSSLHSFPIHPQSDFPALRLNQEWA